MSGIYIKAETPKTCCQCKLMIYSPELVWDDNGRETTGAWVCLLTGELIDSTKREEHCPIIPAADVAPVVHGRWIKSPDCPEEYDICSVCGLNDKHRTRADGEHPAFESIPLFCKWCGAKMDGGKQSE